MAWIDDRIWRRKISVDFTIPQGFPVVRRRGNLDLFYVPVASLQKWPPVLGLDLQARGLPTHLLTSAANACIDAALLRSFTAHAAGRQVAQELDSAIGRLTSETDIDAAEEAYQELEETVPSSIDPHWRRELLAIASSLIRANVLWFPVLGHRCERHVVKFAYDEEIQLSPRADPLPHRLAAGLGWRPTIDYIELDHIESNSSHHVGVTAPDGLVIGDEPRMFFVADQAADLQSGQKPLVNIQTVGQNLHAYVKSSKPARAFLTVPLTTRRKGFISGAWLATAGVTLMLLLFWIWIAQLTQDGAGSVAILVLVPVLLGYIAVRPVAHPSTVRHIARVRDLLMLSGALSIFSAIGLLRYSRPCEVGDARRLFGWVFAAEAAILLLITVSWLRSQGD